MKRHWLDIQSFLTDQSVLSAIDNLSIMTKFELSGIDDTERRSLAEEARRELAVFLKELDDLDVAANGGVLGGVDPRSKELLDAYRSARRDADNYHSALMRAGAQSMLALLEVKDNGDRHALLDCLEELRRVIEGHQQADLSAMLEDF